MTQIKHVEVMGNHTAKINEYLAKGWIVDTITSHYDNTKNIRLSLYVIVKRSE